MKTRAELAEALSNAVDKWFSPTHGGDIKIATVMAALDAWRNAPPDPPAMPTLNWRPHTEVPDPDSRALEEYLIAVNPVTRAPFLMNSLFGFSSKNITPWTSTTFGEPLSHEEYFWLPESELLATLPEVKK